MNQVGRIRELTLQRRHPEALAAAKDLSFKEPHNGEALYLLAANQRCLEQISDALTTLTRLERSHPRMSRLHQERGFCFLSMRDSTRAIAALQQGVNQNPTLMASWSALENLYRLIGDSKGAAAAAKQVANLKQLPSEIVQARNLSADGDFGAAETVLRAYIESGGPVEAQHRAARADLTRVLLGRQLYLEARLESAALLQLEPDNADYRSLHATACAGLCDHEAAIAAFRRVLDAAPTAHVQVLLGHSFKALGRQKEAIEAYHAARDARPGFGDAYWSLANLKTYAFSDSDLAHMQGAVDATGAQTADRIHLHFALGQALEERGCYPESWRHYEQGNALKRAECSYRPELADSNAQQVAMFPRRFFAERGDAGAPDPDPIFIVGLPRSGSTLIEQILASHSLVEATQELNIVPRMVQELQYPGALRDLALDQFHDLGVRYLEEARAFRKNRARKPFFIDKLPTNFRYVALIHMMLPNSKIIDVRREPLACCFSNFKQLYAAGNEFSYDLESAGRYYCAYLELMQHWDTVLPGRIHRLFYEGLVEDTKKSVRGLLDFCGLQFEPDCLEFHKTARSIATPSSEQVRRPLYRAGLEQWRHYRSWLAPLEETLGDARLRYNEARGPAAAPLKAPGSRSS